MSLRSLVRPASLANGGPLAILGLTLVVLLGPFFASPVHAQSPPSESRTSGEAPATAQQLEAVARALEDEAARAELVSQLRTLAEARAASESAPAETESSGTLVVALSEGIAALSGRLEAISGQIARPTSTLEWLERQASEPALRDFWIETGSIGVGVAVAGLVAAALFTALLRRPRRALQRHVPESAWRRIPPLAARTVLELIPAGAFAGAAILAVTIAAPDRTVRLFLLATIQAVVAARVLAVAARTLLSPLSSGLRLLPLADGNAAYAFVWVTRLGRIVVYGFFVVEAARILGASPIAIKTLANLAGLVLVIMLVVLLLQSRERVATAIRGSGERPATGVARALRAARRTLADSWHVLAALYLFAAFAVWMFEVPGGFYFLLQGTLGTVAAVVGGSLLGRVSRRGVERVFHVSDELHQRYPELEARANRYLPFARGVATAVVSAIAVLVALEAWEIHAASILGHRATRAVASSLTRIGLVIGIALVAWEAAQLFVARMLAGNDTPLPGHGQRARTLLPLAQSALLVVIITFASMTILSELGVNIGPLIAGAGIVGLAIGFGAQTLVKDVITGAFILFEDAVAVGDLIEVAGHTGVVEAINIRSVRHRDLSGVVHTVPFSAIDVVRNLSKDYSYYLADVGVAYREDTDECVEIMCEVVEEMRGDPDWGPGILEPLDVMGVQSFDDSAVAIRVRIKTRPREQFPIGREFNRRLKHAFDARDIEIPFPHRTVYFGVAKDGTAPAGRLRLEDGSRESEQETEQAAS